MTIIIVMGLGADPPEMRAQVHAVVLCGVVFFLGIFLALVLEARKHEAVNPGDPGWGYPGKDLRMEFESELECWHALSAARKADPTLLGECTSHWSG